MTPKLTNMFFINFKSNKIKEAAYEKIKKNFKIQKVNIGDNCCNAGGIVFWVQL